MTAPFIIIFLPQQTIIPIAEYTNTTYASPDLATEVISYA